MIALCAIAAAATGDIVWAGWVSHDWLDALYRAYWQASGIVIYGIVRRSIQGPTK